MDNSENLQMKSPKPFLYEQITAYFSMYMQTCDGKSS